MRSYLESSIDIAMAAKIRHAKINSTMRMVQSVFRAAPLNSLSLILGFLAAPMFRSISPVLSMHSMLGSWFALHIERIGIVRDFH